jgi:hypothetical protein
MHAEGELSVQVTALYNFTSGDIQVVQVERLTQDHKEVVARPVQTIPAPAIKIAAKKNT